MSVLDIIIYTTLFIIILLFVKGVIVRIYAKFKPLEYIQLTVTDENGVKHNKKIYIKDEKLLDNILEIRRLQKLAQESNGAK
ncbi:MULTISPECIES: hypothetical protein [Gilliamella]|uniref:Uncharacterized protein n=1 Tax=Gilliamella apicola TaxID=1196095 RepID=A0A556SAX6_9GAMM|nr:MULTISPECIES: hypothetical protein [Gilliamella]MBI0095489.1 hypothetical protein [Gilliamella sp. W8136]TSJ98307.1 hypothetical protein FPQ15_08990 [Gilliamella apicola]